MAQGRAQIPRPWATVSGPGTTTLKSEAAVVMPVTATLDLGCTWVVGYSCWEGMGKAKSEEQGRN